MELRNSLKITQNIINLYSNYNYIKLLEIVRIMNPFISFENYFQRRTSVALCFGRVPFGSIQKMNLKKSPTMYKRVMWSIYK